MSYIAPEENIPPSDWTDADYQRAAWGLMFHYTSAEDRQLLIQAWKHIDRPAWLRWIKHWMEEFEPPPDPPPDEDEP